MDSEDSFGIWVKKRRKALDFTQDALSKRIGCSVATIEKIESDARRPSIQIAELLAQALEIPEAERPIFVKVARGERAVNRLNGHLPIALCPCQSTFPIPPTPLIGREHELDKIARLLEERDCRLLSLVGPGGVGKTRLAIQAALNQKENFRDGVYYVALVGVNQPEFIVPAVADALKFTFHGALEPKTQLYSHLQDKELLIVLDNFEALIPGSGMILELLEKSPGVKLLVTSREQLDVPGEWIFDVAGLPYPQAHITDQSSATVPGESSAGRLEFENYSAVALFLQAARRASAGFSLTSVDYLAVNQICRQVDGMPLGIELAASWVRTLSCAEIAEEIERSLDFLTAAGRGTPERHRSMRVVFDQSWKLLTDEEQLLLRRLSIFRGGFTRDVAEYGADATPFILSNLIAKSWLRRQVTGRYDFHELLRQHAASQLQSDADELKTVAAQHSAYYLDFVCKQEAMLKGMGQIAALDCMGGEMENIRIAWHHAVLHNQAILIRRSLQSFWAFYDARGRYHEARDSFRWAVNLLERNLDSEAHGNPDLPQVVEYLRVCQGWFDMHIGRFQEARQSLETSIERLRSMEAEYELTFALHYLGAIYWQIGEYDKVRQLFEERLVLDQKTGNAWNLGMAYGNLGMLAHAEGNLQEAIRSLRMAVSILRQCGDQRMTAVGLFFLGGTESALGELTEAKAHLNESLQTSKKLRDLWSIAMALNFLGVVAQQQGDYIEARRLFRESLSYSREVGDNWITLRILINLGRVTVDLCEFARAEQHFRDAIKLAVDTQLVPFIVDGLFGLALIRERQGASDIALEWAIHALQHPAVSPETKVQLGRLQADIETRLPQWQIEQISERAQSVPFDRIFADILSDSLFPGA